MSEAVTYYIYRFLMFSAGGYLLVLAIAFIAPGESLFFTLSLAYLLSFVFVGSNLGVVSRTHTQDHKRFYKFFFISLSLRFILIIAALIFILKEIKIHQIYFTVSFIISYIFHSLIEIIFINKILETDTN